jgi:hypothetical protein
MTGADIVILPLALWMLAVVVIMLIVRIRMGKQAQDVMTRYAGLVIGSLVVAVAISVVLWFTNGQPAAPGAFLAPD